MFLTLVVNFNTCKVRNNVYWLHNRNEPFLWLPERYVEMWILLKGVTMGRLSKILNSKQHIII